MFDEKNSTIDEAVEARKQKIEGDDAWNLLAASDRIVVGRGKKVAVYDPNKDDKDEILKICLGRTGNLRAPTLKIGRLLVVGFNDDMYAEYVGK
ncbi:MAG: hypothetical protein L3J49_01910 [Desulfobulbaceae bacterium]|nr:hypothetical protein [Desulfobulbaceae bacterium]